MVVRDVPEKAEHKDEPRAGDLYVSWYGEMSQEGCVTEFGGDGVAGRRESEQFPAP